MQNEEKNKRIIKVWDVVVDYHQFTSLFVIQLRFHYLLSLLCVHIVRIFTLNWPSTIIISSNNNNSECISMDGTKK